MKVLIVEDNPIDAQVLMDMLRRLDSVLIETTLVERLASLAAHRDADMDVVLLDLTLPDGQGAESIRAVQAQLPRVPILVLTADSDSDNSLRMLRSGAQDYLVKGRFDEDTLLRAVRYAIERARADELRQRLYHADRLAVVGQLAAGVAHEVANPAAFVQGNLLLMQRKLEALSYEVAAISSTLGFQDELGAQHVALVAQLDDARRGCDECLSGLARITQVARDLQGYSRVDRDPSETLQLNDVVRTTCKLANSVVRQRATLLTELGELPLLIGNRARLEQVVTNLLLNAAQALPAGEPQRHRVVVSTRVCDEGVVLAVEDTGPGVPAAMRDRIFTPFYTTKPRGTGTGLGLSIALEIARAHGGTLRHRTRGEGKAGACFELVLPVSRTLPAQAVLSEAPKVGGRRRARVLLVDDEPGIRAVFGELLSAEHDVRMASGGREALALIALEPNFEVILCDLLMPDMDGRELYDCLRERFPALLPRIVFCSGGVVSERARAFVSSIDNVLLEKPIAMDTLRSTIDRVLQSFPS